MTETLRAQIRHLPFSSDPAGLLRVLFPDPERRIWLDSAAPGPEGPGWSVLCGTEAGLPPVVIDHEVGPGTDLLSRLREALDIEVIDAQEIPGPFRGGYLGFLGYEVARELGFAADHPTTHLDASWLRSDRFALIDHARERMSLVALDPQGRIDRGAAWLARSADAAVRSTPMTPGRSPSAGAEVTEPERGAYEASVRRAMEFLVAGDSYEVCLTGRTRAESPAPAERGEELVEYTALREANPAPFAAFLQLPDGLTVFSSSPERFLRVEADGTVESRPIKGTAARSADGDEDARLCAALAADPKTRAENLMIADLVRNDIARVSVPGTLRVPHLLAVETLPHVHQMVTTVRGMLPRGRTALDAVASCFPGGSMTGAPKQRTCQIIHELEDSPRGVYSGSIGWLGFDGTADLSIVIRTAVRHDGVLTIGSGGAIVLDSVPAQEYEEMRLKAASVRAGLLG